MSMSHVCVLDVLMVRRSWHVANWIAWSDRIPRVQHQSKNTTDDVRAPRKSQVRSSGAPRSESRAVACVPVRRDARETSMACCSPQTAASKEVFMWTCGATSMGREH